MSISKISKLLMTVFFAGLIFSCVDDDGMSGCYLLIPSKMKIYGNTVEFRYYTGTRRLGMIEYTYNSSNFYSDVQNTKKTLKILYSAKNTIDSLIIITQPLLNKPEIWYDTIVYDYDRNSSIIKAKSSKAEQLITLENSRSRRVASFLSMPISGGALIRNYNYTSSGNIYSYTENNGQEYRFEFDNENGIFSYVNLPQWFLLTQLPEAFPFGYRDNMNFYNNCIKETSSLTGSTEFVYEYNQDGFPVCRKKEYKGNAGFGISEDRTTIEYYRLYY